MRAEVFVFLAAALLCCAGLFMPVGQVSVTGKSMVPPSTISLFQLQRSDETVRQFLTGYRDSVSAKIGARALAKVAPHLRGRARSDAADVQDAMAALDSIRDEDIDTVGSIAKAVMWSLLGLNVLGAYLLLAAHPPSGRGRGRAIAALITSLVGAAIAVATYLVLRRVVAEANHEVGAELFALRFGAYVVPVAGVVAFAAALALMVAFVRHRRPA